MITYPKLDRMECMPKHACLVVDHTLRLSLCAGARLIDTPGPVGWNTGVRDVQGYKGKSDTEKADTGGIIEVS